MNGAAGGVAPYQYSISGNSARQTVRRKSGWFLKGRRTFLGLTVGGGGAIVGALAVKLGVVHGSQLTPAILSLIVLGLGTGGIAVGMAQCGGLVRAWGRSEGDGDPVEGGAAASLAAPAAWVAQTPLSIILAVVAGDVAVTATGLGGGWVDLVMLCMWTLGLLAGFILVLQRAR